MSSLRVEQQISRKILHFLVYLFLEGVIIILLYIVGLLAFLCSEFAKFFDLAVPCLLCCRLDNILVHKNSHFYYNDSLCEAHKKDISSLAYCQVHSKLSGIKSMCDRCLLSFANERDSDIDTGKSLVGILQRDIDSFVEEDHKNLLKGSDFVTAQEGSVNMIKCSCCGEPLTRNSKYYAKYSSMNTPTLSNAPISSPRAPTVVLTNEESLRSVELPHIQYTQLQLMPEANEDRKDAMMSLLPDSEDLSEEGCKTPSFIRGNKFVKIPLSEPTSPRFVNRQARNIQLEKELLIETNDKNAASGAEGEVLQKQVPLDGISLIELHMELDEERTASEIAANNAMAMITKLQAEKADMQMEALQYQRMMDEQAEYDQEALKFLQDQIKILEDELETYREQYGPLQKEGLEECVVDGDEDYQDYKSEFDTDVEYTDFKSQSPSNTIDESHH